MPRILITAGPTHEPIDRVRYLGNRSSGRMGVALAQAALARSWPTTLLLGPATIQPPEDSQLRTVRFQTAADLQKLLAEHWPTHDVLFMAAAVADYRPALPAPPAAPASTAPLASRQSAHTKLRRSNAPLHLELEPTPDLLAELAAITKPGQFVVGFALEPAETLHEMAADKLRRKRLDAIVANPLETMDSEAVSAIVILKDGREVAAPKNMAKREFADWLLRTLQPS